MTRANSPALSAEQAPLDFRRLWQALPSCARTREVFVDERTELDALVCAIEELREARTAAEGASAAKSEFLSSMSHELRTPLNAILGFAQLLHSDRKEPPSDRQKERISHILKGGAHLLRLIDDILDLSRIEASGVSISTEAVGVLEVLEEVKRTLEPFAADQSIRLEFEALMAEVPAVSADRTRFAQILMNFGSNAIKYNRPEGKVTFSISSPAADYVRVSVRDTGMGIPAHQQSKLFQPFQRAGQETGPIEGTGIGLVITKRLADLMKGRIGFRSIVNEGSEFWVDMPVHASSARTTFAPPQPDSLTKGIAGSRKNVILYVEDNPANVSFMQHLIGMLEGVELLVAPTAEIGLELARSHRPAVIVMDIHLPGISGIEALQILRGAPETARTPVVALTAAATDRDKQRGKAAGFSRYLTKPVKVDEFLATLEALLT